MNDEDIAAQLSTELRQNDEMAGGWIDPADNVDLRSFGIDGSVDLVALVAFVRSKL
jgi:hypothetical protein